MWKTIKEIYYRYKVRAHTKGIIALTKGREGLKAKQAVATKRREYYQAKLDTVIKES